MKLDCNGKVLDLDSPVVMGILNVTPDSFSDGGRFVEREAAIRRALAMQAEGAALIDVGGESTRPGSAGVGLQEELDRVIPVIEALHAELGIPVSVDTSKPEVMREAVAAGAGLINDVNAMRAEGALEVAAVTRVPVCLMHMQGEPRTMQQAPRYGDVVAEVKAFLEQRIEACVEAGVAAEKILLDPGFGFGKALEHNLELLRRLDRLLELGRPLLVGISRKSMLGALTGRETGERMAASVAAAVLAVARGARIVRAHDVAATVDAIRITTAVVEEAVYG